MEPKVNIDPFIPPNEIDVHSIDIESDMIETLVSSRDKCNHLSYTSHGFLYLDSLNNSTPPIGFVNTLDSQFVGQNGDQVQGGHIP